MINNLDEAIAHAKEVAKDMKLCCEECASEHEQLAEWLTELKQRRESDKKGKWEHIGGDEFICSECGHVITTEGSWEKPLSIGSYYCENCGADMRGDAGV